MNIPPSLSEATLAEWLQDAISCDFPRSDALQFARAVRALVEAKCVESCRALMNAYASHVSYGEIDEIVARVLS